MIGEYIVIVGLLVCVISQWVAIRSVRRSLDLMRSQRNSLGERVDVARATIERMRKDRLRLAVSNDKR